MGGWHCPAVDDGLDLAMRYSDVAHQMIVELSQVGDGTPAGEFSPQETSAAGDRGNGSPHESASWCRGVC